MEGNPVMLQTGFESDIPVFGQYTVQSVQLRGLATFYCKNILLIYFPSNQWEARTSTILLLY
jgi:hypothetical protein